MSNQSTAMVPIARIERRILFLRGEKVMLDSDLAELYGVEARVLNQAVKRNLERFPEDFMFRLSPTETRLVMEFQMVNSSQSVMSSRKSSRIKAGFGVNSSHFVTSSRKYRGLSYRPYAFTEQGVAMLSSVLRSERAVQVNIAIMRTFVQLRQILATHANLAHKLQALERSYDSRFKMVFDAIHKLMEEKRKPKPKREIGFHTLMSKPAKANGAKTARIAA